MRRSPRTTTSLIELTIAIVIVALLPRVIDAQGFISGLDSDAIQRSGERTTEELLRNLTLANANGVPISNNATNPTRGASSVSLRGMDPGDTLVLINRMRIAPYPVGAGVSFTQPFVDLYSIPLAGIEYIGVLARAAPPFTARMRRRHNRHFISPGVSRGGSFSRVWQHTR